MNGVEPGRGGDVAAAVRTAVDAANRYVSEQATAAEANRAARAEAHSDLERAANEAQESMRARLGL